jgi:ubiquinone/menaquinone biosynthesis C-methylase UbiE
MTLRNPKVLALDNLLLSRSLTRRWRSRLLYPILTRLMGSNLQSPTKFLNYGYAPLPREGGPCPPSLAPEDEPDRLSIQLYHRVVFPYVVDHDVLEISCGHGGGADYIARYLGPRSVVGMDLNPAAIAFCSKYYRDVPNLTYRVGDAEHLPLPDRAVDVVVNIEASHCYGSMEKFLLEVRRVLHPGGYLLFADFRLASQKASLEALFGASGFTVRDQSDVTPNVVAALQEDNARKLELIEQSPRFLRGGLAEFSGTEGSCAYQTFLDRKELYLAYALQVD